MSQNTEIDNAYREILLANVKENSEKPRTKQLSFYKLAQETFEGLIKHNKRILVMHTSNKNPQSCTVVTLERAYPNFVKGYTLVKLTGEKIPYTLNYTALVSKGNAISIIEED